MNRNDYVKLAADLLEERWPQAIGAFAAGSILRGQGKPNSDIDMVVLLPEGPRQYRGFLWREGMPFDVFVHHPGSLRHYFRQGWRERRPVLQNIIAEAELLPAADRRLWVWQRYARNLLRHGPPPVEEKDWIRRRYFLMSQLDDYADAAHAERAAIAASLYELLLDALCDRANVWRGCGKWAARWARRADPEMFERIEAARAAGEIDEIGREILALIGGPLEEEWLEYGPNEYALEKLRLLRPQAAKR